MTLKQRTAIGLLALVGVLLLSIPSRAQYATESTGEIGKSLKAGKAVLVDVREERETTLGYVDGAALVPLSLLQEGKDDKDFGAVLAQRFTKKTVLYVHCVSGKRAIVAADILKGFGYDARPVQLGFNDLVRAGFAAARPKR